MPRFAHLTVRAALPCALALLAAACSSGNEGGDDGPRPTSVTVASGNFASGRYGAVLTPSPTILVAGASGPLSGVTVNFSVQEGGGSVASASAVSNGSGIVTVPAWTLGPAPGTNILRATAGTLGANVTAVAVAGPPTTVIIEAGNNQDWVEKSIVPVAPTVKVTDGTYGVAGVRVTFAVASGGGTVGTPLVNTNVDGIAALDGWRLGDAGTNTLTATAAGVTTPATFTATAAPLVITTLSKTAGDAQSGYAGNYAGALPQVTVLNQFNQPAEGVVVSFAAGGGGTVINALDTTGVNGRASPGAWRWGSGAQTLTATAGTVSTDFTATAANVPASQFNIEVRYLGTTPDPDIQAAFTNAAARWAQVIVGDLPNNVNNLPLIQVNFGGSVGITTCSPALSGAAAQIDDIVIFADVRTIDGAGGILGGATHAHQRSDLTTITGCMIFDLADLESMQAANILGDVILHEMGHVIGIGAIWEDKHLLIGGCPTGSLKPYFLGSSSRQAFRGSLASVFTDSIVPVEGSVNGQGLSPAPCINGQSDGTRDSHWSESVLNNELMTGYVDVPGPNPLSTITAASVRDLGYVVNDAASDAFSLLRAPALRAPGQRIKLHEFDFSGRRELVDREGNIVSRW